MMSEISSERDRKSGARGWLRQSVQGPVAGRLLLVLLGCLAGLLILEAAVRISGGDYPDFYRPDRHCGTALREGSKGWYRKESTNYISISSQGLRDREHPTQASPGTTRVAVLGDSYAEAFQVPVEQAFWSVMERRLNEDFSFRQKRVEVINFGVGGYGTAQELQTLRHRVWQFHPEIVLLAFTTGNDVRNNSPALNQDDRCPYFVHRAGKLVLDEGFLDWYTSRRGLLGKMYYRLLGHSSLMRALKAGRYAMSRIRRENGQNDLVRQSGLEEWGLDDMIYRPPEDFEWKEAWSVTEEILVLMNREIRENRGIFLVVTLTNGAQVHPDRLLRLRMSRALNVPDLFYPDRRVRALGEREGFPVLNLAPEFQEWADRTGGYLHGFGDQLGTGHWNVAGHRLAGEMMAHFLEEEALREAPPVAAPRADEPDGGDLPRNGHLPVHEVVQR